MLTLQKDLDRFWAKVNKTDSCWLWIAAKNNKGYGRFKFETKFYSSHIISYKLHNTDYDPTKFVCHRCDTPSCCNPNHLFLGTQSENMLDCSAKGRDNSQAKGAKGETNGKARLTEQDVISIKTRMKNGERTCNIIRDYTHVHKATIKYIKSGKTWKHIVV
jgi:hypothetical protein